MDNSDRYTTKGKAEREREKEREREREREREMKVIKGFEKERKRIKEITIYVDGNEGGGVPGRLGVQGLRIEGEYYHYAMLSLILVIQFPIFQKLLRNTFLEPRYQLR